MSQRDAVQTYRHIAEVLRAVQRVAIEEENAPDTRKVLRHISTQEAAGLLGITPRQLTAALAQVGGGEGGAARTRLSFDQLGSVRRVLFDQTGDLAMLPRRRPDRGEHLAVLAVANFKGGSTKSTTSVHLAQYLARAGYRILLVDLDSQGSATAQFGIDPATEVHVGTCFAAWTEARAQGARPDAGGLCQRTYWPTIDIVPAGAALADAEARLAERASAGQLEEPLYFDELSAFLGAVEDRYDVAILDTRPDVNMLMTVALHAAEVLIVPTRATMTDLASTGEFFAHLASYFADYRQTFGGDVRLAATKIMIGAYDPTDRSQEALAGLLRARFPDSVLPGEFLHSRIMGTAGMGKETLYEYEPSTDRAGYNRVVASANQVNQAIEREIQRLWGRGIGKAAAVRDAVA